MVQIVNGDLVKSAPCSPIVGARRNSFQELSKQMAYEEEKKDELYMKYVDAAIKSHEPIKCNHCGADPLGEPGTEYTVSLKDMLFMRNSLYGISTPFYFLVLFSFFTSAFWGLTGFLATMLVFCVGTIYSPKVAPVPEKHTINARENTVEEDKENETVSEVSQVSPPLTTQRRPSFSGPGFKLSGSSGSIKSPLERVKQTF
eukprot:TRINITY_DN296_c0_g1_i1.p1 TRINITY_DN296_c0_g1~~TRINITY_DN296_c0_g1_i1.p1  ORF type:complete len:201 (-),score=25.82 TRINITY_DN296_c0_g1_i1:119-721(-)